MPARSPKVSKPKNSARPLQPDTERRDKWQMASIGEDGTLAIEFHLAQATLMTPPPSIDQVVQMIRWAWTTFGQMFFEDIVREAIANPGRAARDHAVEAARRIWADVMVERPQARGGRPRKQRTAGADTIWVVFHLMLADARRRDPKTTVADVRSRMVRYSGWGFDNERQLKDFLMKIDRGPGKEDRERQLKAQLDYREKLRSKNQS